MVTRPPNDTPRNEKTYEQNHAHAQKQPKPKFVQHKSPTQGKKGKEKTTRFVSSQLVCFLYVCRTPRYSWCIYPLVATDLVGPIWPKSGWFLGCGVLIGAYFSNKGDRHQLIFVRWSEKVTTLLIAQLYQASVVV